MSLRTEPRSSERGGTERQARQERTGGGNHIALSHVLELSGKRKGLAGSWEKNSPHTQGDLVNRSYPGGTFPSQWDAGGMTNHPDSKTQQHGIVC